MRQVAFIVVAAWLLSIVGCERNGAAPKKGQVQMPTELSATDKYIIDAIHTWVWSGFYSPTEVDSMIDDILEQDANEPMLRAAVMPEFAKKLRAEKEWPDITDCDRLKSAFAALDKRGILCLHNAGYEMSDGHSDAFEILSGKLNGRYFGYCFYHGQDVEGALEGWGLMLAFDDVNGDVREKMRVGLALKEELERIGFALEWDGTPDKRINIPDFDWKNRSEYER